jgi:hypothetical protein
MLSYYYYLVLKNTYDGKIHPSPTRNASFVADTNGMTSVQHDNSNPVRLFSSISNRRRRNNNTALLDISGISILNNNKGTIISPEYKKIYPNMGLCRGEHKGNMIIHFHIEFPEKLTEEQIEKLINTL